MNVQSLSINDTKVSGLYGIIVCGGNSSRMGTDKSMLVYYDKPHCYYLYEMLESFCESVFISCNNEQENKILPGYRSITDHPDFQHSGPMSSLLSAFKMFTEKNLLIIGCDYPFLTNMDIRNFLKAFIEKDAAAAFYNEAADLYEPLLAYYNRKIANNILNMHVNKEYSLQQLLITQHAVKFYPENLQSIQSIDTEEDYRKAIASIRLMRKPQR